MQRDEKFHKRILIFFIFAELYFLSITNVENKKLKLPIGIQTLETVRTEGYVYVDKTKHLVNIDDTKRQIMDRKTCTELNLRVQRTGIS